VSGVGILVVDDDPPIRRMLERTLVAEGYEVRTAGDGGSALVEVERAAPDLLVLDVAMPGLGGLEVCRRVRAKGLGFPVLLLTARDAVDERVAGLDAGADDYLVKPFAPEELLARIRALLRRGREPAEVLAFGDLVLEVSTRSAHRGDRRLVLSGREAALLELLLRNSPQVVSRELAQREGGVVPGKWDQCCQPGRSEGEARSGADGGQRDQEAEGEQARVAPTGRDQAERQEGERHPFHADREGSAGAGQHRPASRRECQRTQ
jgi:two-component system, OmpR family, response regulator MprA